MANIALTFPDGSVKEFRKSVTALEVAKALRYMLLAVLISGSVGADGQGAEHNIYVHVVDAKTGKPVPGVNVWVGGPPAASRLARLTAKTNQEGLAAFELRDPLPATLSISLHSGYWDDCSMGEYETSAILDHGASAEEGFWVTELKLQKINNRFHPRPGEVYFFACHVPFAKWLAEWFRSFK